MWYFWIYAALSCSYGACSGIRAFVLLRCNIFAVRKLHNKMIGRLLYAPINRFFERIPVGRILNRFSEDLNTCDLNIPFTLGSNVLNFYFILGMSLLLSYLSHWKMTPFIFVLIIF